MIKGALGILKILFVFPIFKELSLALQPLTDELVLLLAFLAKYIQL